MRREESLALAAGMARPYRICPPRLPGGGPAGVFAGMRDGQSVDFHDYREYQPGDDLRRVDWRAYARNGQMHLRLFREEVSPVVELHLDTSASMAAYPGKEQIALFLAAFLHVATLAAEGRPALCRDGRRFGGSDFQPALMATEFAGGGGARSARRSPGGVLPLRFYLSDYLFDEGLATLFQGHAAGSLHFTPVMLLSESEARPPWRGFYRLREVEHVESSLDLSLTDKAVSDYKTRLARHEEALSRLARRHGSNLLRLDTPDDQVDRAHLDALVRRLAGERVVTAR